VEVGRVTTLDLGVQKTFPFGEAKRLEFRAEFINLTNTPVLNSPTASLGPSLGEITSSQGPRNIQFAFTSYY
jgi:hypothetical protein